MAITELSNFPFLTAPLPLYIHRGTFSGNSDVWLTHSANLSDVRTTLSFICIIRPICEIIFDPVP